jgi:uncharacterized membrane protein YfcA
MDSFATVLGALLGLMLGIAAPAMALVFPKTPELKLLPVSVLGALIGMSACTRRHRPRLR